jgi:hypothetical protein
MKSPTSKSHNAHALLSPKLDAAVVNESSLVNIISKQPGGRSHSKKRSKSRGATKQVTQKQLRAIQLVLQESHKLQRKTKKKDPTRAESAPLYKKRLNIKK